MANEEHLAILRQGVEVWNQWREENPEIKPNLKNITLIGFDFQGINFRETNLIETDLRDSNLSFASLMDANLLGANLVNVNFSHASLLRTQFQLANLSYSNFTKSHIIQTNFRLAYLRGANLEEANLEKDIPGHEGLDIFVNIAHAIFCQANLTKANLKRQNLNGLNFSQANLTNADLSGVQALETNFKGAILTGACIEDWNYNSATNLDNVICDYIYLKANQQERRPYAPNKIFTSGEFTKLYQKALETVDLIFQNGIDWKAFFISLEKLKIESGSDELSIQSLEDKGDGFLIIRVNVPHGTDKVELEKYLRKQYQLEAQLEAKNEQLEAKDKHIESLTECVKLLASRPPIHVEAKAVAQGNIHQTGTFAIGVNQGEIKDNAKVAGILNEAQKQTLTEAADEIQQLLEQLSLTYPTSTSKEQITVLAEVVDKIESNPTLKAKVIKTLKAAGSEALKEAIDHPLVNILMAAFETWTE